MRHLIVLSLSFLSLVFILTLNACKEDDPQPDVIGDFTSDARQVVEGTAVTFTDLSENFASEWSWTFPGGTPATSTEQNPVVTYNEPGIYDVTMQVYNNDSEDIVTKDMLIVVLPGDGLTGFYKLDDDINDSSPTGNDAFDWSYTATEDRFGNAAGAVMFDGIDDFIQIPHNSAIDFGGDDNFTISVWVKTEEQVDLTATTNEIISKWLVNPNDGYPYALRYWNQNAEQGLAGYYYARQWYTSTCDQSENNRLNSVQPVNIGQWDHLIFMKTGFRLDLYQNGQLVAQKTLTPVNCSPDSSYPLFLGKRLDNTRFFKGSVDDLRIYRRSLTAGGIEALLMENVVLNQ